MNLSSILGVDINKVALTMLGLVGVYLVVKNPAGINSLVKTGFSGWNSGLVILQGRNPRTVL